LDKFFDILRESDTQCCYGLKSVQYALEQGAIETMLISDNLFRANNIMTRKTYVQLAEISEKKYGVNTVIIGTMSPAGERLKLMTGVAAILRYPLPGIDEIEEDDDDEDDDEDKKDPFRISENDEQ